jgi:hypothetical protein
MSRSKAPGAPECDGGNGQDGPSQFAVSDFSDDLHGAGLPLLLLEEPATHMPKILREFIGVFKLGGEKRAVSH